VIRAFFRTLAEGPLAQQLRRFAAVGVLTAGVQLVLLWLLVETVELNYLLSATIAIEVTIILSYVLNNAWTFQSTRNAGVVDYTVGLLKTNVVRWTAIPIQLGILFGLVEWVDSQYLLANAVAIVLSGIYRYVLDARWTWG